ncbi:MAG: 5-formyltetrahydrofolate cyclo-ligase [Elusimicrobia bacterium]|nr:5-formyltetrahydrofolate cyclo-ligase [Elusimicrobiota bacterium]
MTGLFPPGHPAHTTRQKHFLRQYLRSAVLSWPESVRRRESRQVALRLAGMPVFRKARTVGVYLSLPHEMDTSPILRLCRDLNKQVAVPVIFPDKKQMRFAHLPVGSSKKLTRNGYGISEPAESARRFVPPARLDLVITPGRAFTPKGDRLGAGGGYFDRFLSRYPKTRTLGIAFSLQIQPSLPLSPHDRPVDAVLTGDRLYTRKRRNA